MKIVCIVLGVLVSLLCIMIVVLRFLHDYYFSDRLLKWLVAITVICSLLFSACIFYDGDVANLLRGWLGIIWISVLVLIGNFIVIGIFSVLWTIGGDAVCELIGLRSDYSGSIMFNIVRFIYGLLVLFVYAHLILINLIKSVTVILTFLPYILRKIGLAAGGESYPDFAKKGESELMRLWKDHNYVDD